MFTRINQVDFYLEVSEMSCGDADLDHIFQWLNDDQLLGILCFFSIGKLEIRHVNFP